MNKTIQHHQPTSEMDYNLNWWLFQYTFSFRWILTEVLKYEGEIDEQEKNKGITEME